LFAPALLLLALTPFGCGTKEGVPLSTAPTDPSVDVAAGPPREVEEEIARLRRIAAADDRGVRSHYEGASTAGKRPIVVPAGSVDALAGAIAAAGHGGVVILERGLHTEHSTVEIDRRVAIVGETGAVIESGVTHSNDVPTILRPAFWIHDAGGVTIWNLTMRPIGSVAGTAILLENAPGTTVGWNSITDFQYGVILHYADASTVIGNKVVASPLWQTGELVDALGVLNMNGARVRIVDNDMSRGLLNAFCAGANGYYLWNDAHQGFVGMILCKIPAGSYQLPSGAVVGSDIPGGNWFVQGNDGSNNLYAGLLVIDGANKCTVVNNTGSGNGAYDIEMLGTTCLFGFETPTSFDNKLVVGPHPNLRINDFGQNNRIIGSAVITHDISAPCAQGTVSARVPFRK